MRYVGNVMRINNAFSNDNERAVFPQGSIIPDVVREESVYRNETRNNTFSRIPNNNEESENMMQTENNSVMGRGNESAVFPYANGGVLRRENSYNREIDDNRSSMMERTPVSRRPNANLMCRGNQSISEFLCEYMGKYISIEFLFGADTYVKKSGILSESGMNFIVLEDEMGNNKTVCDLLDAKFINLSVSPLETDIREGEKRGF